MLGFLFKAVNQHSSNVLIVQRLRFANRCILILRLPLQDNDLLCDADRFRLTTCFALAGFSMNCVGGPILSWLSSFVQGLRTVPFCRIKPHPTTLARSESIYQSTRAFAIFDTFLSTCLGTKSLTVASYCQAQFSCIIELCTTLQLLLLVESI